jgi:hypothetical protein
MVQVSREEASGGGDKRGLRLGNQSEDEDIAFCTARFSLSVLSSGWNAAQSVTSRTNVPAATNKTLRSHLLTAPEIA